MTRLLLRTAVTNLRSRPLQTALVGIIIAAASATLALAVSLRAGADDPYEKVARATNSGDVHVFGFSGTADLRPVAHERGVRAADGPYRFADVRIASRPSAVGLALEGVGDRPPRIDRPQVTEGRWLSPAQGEVVLERSFARDRGIGVGQRIAATGHRGRATLTVVGLAVSAAQGPYPGWDPGRSWVSRATLASVEPDRSRLGQLLDVQLADRSASGAFVEDVKRRFGPDEVDAFDWRDVRQAVTDKTSTSTVVLGSTSLFALLAVGFIIANAIGGRVLAARRDIGLLKAAGFTPGGVTALFVLESLILALAASVAGTALGIALSPLLLESTANLLGTATPSGLRAVTVLAGVAGVVAVVCLFTALPAWRAGRLGVLEAIALGRTSVSARPSQIARAAVALRMPPAVVLGVKDAFANRSRAVMTIASLALTMTTVVMALGTEATYRRAIGDSSLRAKPYELLVEADGVAPGRVRSLLGAHPGQIAGTATITGLQASTAAGTHDFQTRALGGDYRRRPYAVRDGRMIARPGEAIVGRGLLDTLGLHVGDSLALRVRGTPVNLRIVGRYIEPDNDGQIAIYDERSLPAAVRRAEGAPAYALQLSDRKDAHAVGAALVRESRGALQVDVTEDEVRQERNDLRPVLYGTEAVLLAIGLVNLLTTLLLGIRERVRDFAIFKVVGLTPRQVLAAVTSSGTLLSAVAVVAGVVIGLPVFHALVVLTNPTDGPDLVTAPPWWWVALMFSGALFFTTLASLLPARRAAAIKPAAALRYE